MGFEIALKHDGKLPRRPNILCKADKKAMIRNRYNRIPHSAPNTKWERDSYN